MDNKARRVARVTLWIGLAAPLLLAACTNEPQRTAAPSGLVETYRERLGAYREGGGAVGFTLPRFVSLCYGRPINDSQSLRTAVRDICPAEEQWEVRLVEQSVGLSRCPLLQPLQATFVCRKDDTPAALLPR